MCELALAKTAPHFKQFPKGHTEGWKEQLLVLLEAFMEFFLQNINSFCRLALNGLRLKANISWLASRVS